MKPRVFSWSGLRDHYSGDWRENWPRLFLSPISIMSPTLHVYENSIHFSKSLSTYKPSYIISLVAICGQFVICAKFSSLDIDDVDLIVTISNHYTNISDDDIDDGAYMITMMMTLMIQIFA